MLWHRNMGVKQLLNLEQPAMATPQTTEDTGRARRARRFLTIAVTSIAVAIGVATALVPDAVIALSRKLVTPFGIYIAAAVRCGIGFALLLIARGARSPAELRLMGFALYLRELCFPFLVSRTRRLELSGKRIT